MTEQEYINTTDLTRVRDAISVLGNILPENSIVIKKEEMTNVMKILYSWGDELTKLVKTH